MRKLLIGLFIVGFVLSLGISQAVAATAAAIDASVDSALQQFKVVKGGEGVLDKAKGVLVFPSVFKAGIGFGGEYGEGALRIGGKSVDYYSTAAASFGFQLGAQKKTIIIAFMDQTALNNFQNSSGWKVGLDASIAVIAVGADGSIDTANTNQPIIAFVTDQKGLMYNLSLEGAKITKLAK